MQCLQEDDHMHGKTERMIFKGDFSMGTEMGVFLTYAGAVVLIFLIGKIFLWPLKLVLKLVLNSIAGAFLILIVNVLGAAFHVMIPLNFISAVIVGILGIPGAVLMLILNMI